MGAMHTRWPKCFVENVELDNAITCSLCIFIKLGARVVQPEARTVLSVGRGSWVADLSKQKWTGEWSYRVVLIHAVFSSPPGVAAIEHFKFYKTLEMEGRLTVMQ